MCLRGDYRCGLVAGRDWQMETQRRLVPKIRQPIYSATFRIRYTTVLALGICASRVPIVVAHYFRRAEWAPHHHRPSTRRIHCRTSRPLRLVSHAHKKNADARAPTVGSYLTICFTRPVAVCVTSRRRVVTGHRCRRDRQGWRAKGWRWLQHARKTASVPQVAVARTVRFCRNRH